MINFAKLADYRSGIRPVGDESLPHHIDREFARISDVIGGLVAAFKQTGSLKNAANDAAAATAGVAVGNLYRNGSVLMVRVV